MMKSFPPVRLLAVSFLLVTALLRAAEPTAAGAHPEPVLAGPGAETLAQVERTFAKLSVDQGAVAAFRAFLAEDAIQLPAHGQPVQGREKVLAWLKSAGMDTPGMVLNWWPLRAEVAASGDLGYTFGDWEVRLKMADAASKPLARGKFTTVWKKQTDGTWKVAFDTGNEDTPMKGQ